MCMASSPSLLQFLLEAAPGCSPLPWSDRLHLPLFQRHACRGPPADHQTASPAGSACAAPALSALSRPPLAALPSTASHDDPCVARSGSSQVGSRWVLDSQGGHVLWFVRVWSLHVQGLKVPLACQAVLPPKGCLLHTSTHLLLSATPAVPPPSPLHTRNRHHLFRQSHPWQS